MGERKKSKAEAQSSSKRQQNANMAVKAIKYNVRAFPKATGMIESEFKGVRQHSGSPCHTMDQSSTQLFMCSNWLTALPHADNFGDVLDHGHKSRTVEPGGKHYHWVPGIQQKAERRHSFVPMHHDINLLERNSWDHTHLWNNCSHAASTHGHMQTHMHINTHN